MTGNCSPLRTALDAVIAERRCSLNDLTVLSPQVDPFRFDTPAGHRLGRWLRDAIEALGLTGRRMHLRGLHYAISQAEHPVLKPDGTPYLNNDADWEWLSGKAIKAARWLGYVPFEAFTDRRNDAPEIAEYSGADPEPEPYLSAGIYISGGVEPGIVQIPDPFIDQAVPGAGVLGFEVGQPYHIVLIGEKSSLHEVLDPLARRYRCDLYLPMGEISDPLIYQMAVTAARDGRPMVVLYFADSDPGGHQMAISVARKLQAFERLLPDMPEWAMHRAALTPEQVLTLGLPSKPLKESERRAARWREAFGVEQTEVDALATLRPGDFTRIAAEAIEAFYDRTLASRVRRARNDWVREAQQAVDAGLSGDTEVDAIRVDAQALAAEIPERIAGLREQIDEVRSEFEELRDRQREITDRVDALPIEDLDLPEIIVPDAEFPEEQPQILVDSRWDFAEQCRRLIESKSYRTGETR